MPSPSPSKVPTHHHTPLSRAADLLEVLPSCLFFFCTSSDSAQSRGETRLGPMWPLAAATRGALREAIRLAGAEKLQASSATKSNQRTRGEANAAHQPHQKTRHGRETNRQTQKGHCSWPNGRWALQAKIVRHWTCQFSAIRGAKGLR